MKKNKDKDLTQEEIKNEEVSATNEEINKNDENLSNEEETNEETKENSKEQEYLELLQRTQAEFLNYKKRTVKVESDARKDGIIEAVKKFLPVLDSFDSAQKQTTNEEFIKANEIILNQLNKALEDLGVKKIEALNQKFDYNKHNAILVDCVDDVEDNVVLEVFQEGYIMGDKVIRHSIVKINKK